ncbi:hypothetical protein OH492_12390 [Vibrio chagasii]|nr:hypothetical protein [Vibrio chagasii]
MAWRYKVTEQLSNGLPENLKNFNCRLHTSSDGAGITRMVM